MPWTDEEGITHYSPEEIRANDRRVSCPHTGCGAAAGEECRGMPPGQIHFGRRLLWLFRDRRPDLLPDEHREN